MKTEAHAWWVARGRPVIPCPSDIAPLLGKMADRVVAGLAGVSDGTVSRWRREAGIAPYCAKKSNPGPKIRIVKPRVNRSVEEILADTPPLLRACVRDAR